MKPGPTIHPALLEADLILSHDSTGSGSGIEDAEGLSERILWNVEALKLDTMNWTIFPSTGILLPGERRVSVGARHYLTCENTVI